MRGVDKGRHSAGRVDTHQPRIRLPIPQNHRASLEGWTTRQIGVALHVPYAKREVFGGPPLLAERKGPAESADEA